MMLKLHKCDIVSCRKRKAEEEAEEAEKKKVQAEWNKNFEVGHFFKHLLQENLRIPQLIPRTNFYFCAYYTHTASLQLMGWSDIRQVYSWWVEVV